MELLYFFEKLRTPLLNDINQAFTYFGEELVTLAAILIILWCVDKYFGRYMLFVGVMGIMTNTLLKCIFRIPRPWAFDSNFTIVESARAAATGYSFPSGHTANAAVLFWSLAVLVKNKILKTVFIAIPFLVAISRMYLGVHALLDISVSLTLSAVLVAGGHYIYKKLSNRTWLCFITGSAVVVLALISVVIISIINIQLSEDILVQSGLEDAYKVLGLAAALPAVCILDDKYIKYPTTGKWGYQIAKLLVGTLLVVAVKELLKIPFCAIIPGNPIAEFIRYFAVAMTGGLIVPWMFTLVLKKLNSNTTVSS
ncbi:MAG: hypothetical protein A2Y17_03920 [Clostridiales bacterium GWF2_38_85]|nr:MAG: hypothetical protein A2Y17_03920 [Clostridiales bacterium GWF2_38_85]HBL83943.1 hypothetical protein [Clostridiales bacterium]